MRVSVLGYGTIGSGVYDLLQRTAGFEAGPVLVRKGKARLPFMTDDLDAILGDASIDAVAECIGGVEPAFSYARAALEAGKHVANPNKMLEAEKGIELEAMASEQGLSFLFSAACGGGIPLLSELRATARTRGIREICGILNGTTNYILDRMQSDGMPFDRALAEAKELGYAEADPSQDLSGADTLRKIRLACAAAFSLLPIDGMEMEGIGSFTAADSAVLKERGLVCRLAGRAALKDGVLQAYVQPTLFPAGSAEASVRLNANLASWSGDSFGRLTLLGEGAGRYPTASAVVRDLAEAGRGAASMMPETCRRVCADNGDAVHRYLVRTGVSFLDRFPLPEGTEHTGEDAFAATAPMSVKEMHALTREIRAEGGQIFFSALGETAGC